MAATHTKHSHTVLHVLIIVLILIALVIFAKHFIRQSKWTDYVVESQKSMGEYKNLNSVEDANVLVTTIVNIPEGNPLINQPKNLQEYVSRIGDETGRYIIIVDTAKKIIANTISANIGSKYDYDSQNEVAKTIGDSHPRYFVEKSGDYPGGINQTVIPIKNSEGATVGALIISDSKIFSQ